MVGTDRQPLENAPSSHLQGSELLETGLILHSLHRVFHSSADLMGPLFFVFLNISLCDSFGGVDRNICGTVALYNETTPVRGLAQSLRSLGMTGFSGGVDSS